jgi:hypothetical protein
MSGERLIRPAQARITRRKLLMGLGVGAAVAPLSACSFDTGSPTALNILDKAEALTKAAQRALLGPETAMAREFPPGAISPISSRTARSIPRIPNMSRCARAALRTGNWKSAALSSGR